MAHSLSIRCPAKLNLCLSVGAPTEPGGLHPIASWMVALDFGDDLTVQKLDGAPLSPGEMLSVAFADDAPAPHDVDWPIEKDLAYRAWQAMQDHAGRPLPIRATLSKRVPAGAGLGGGSADCAAMLVAVDELFALNTPADTLIEIAHGLGSDVPFSLSAIRGIESAVVEGAGETIEHAPLTTPFDAVLVLPPFHCDTSAVYRAFDEKGGGVVESARVRRQAGLTEPEPHRWFNDLAEPAVKVQPELGRLLSDLAAGWEKNPAKVTGAGSAVFVPCRSAEAAHTRAPHIQAITGHPCVAIRSIGRA